MDKFYEVTMGEERTCRFFIRKFEPFLGAKILVDLQKQLLGPLVGGIDAGKLMGQDAGAAMLSALQKLSEHLDGARMEKLMKVLLDPNYISVSIDEAEPVKMTEGAFNQTKLGVADLIELMVHSIKANYEDFGRRALTLFGKARENLPEAFQAGSATGAKLN